MAQQYFTIPSTGVYGTYKFYQNDQIPMELAVELGIEGAALAEGDYFSSEEQAAIRAEAEALIVGGDAEIDAYVHDMIAAPAARFDDGYEPISSQFFVSAASSITANAAHLVRFRLPFDATITGATIYTADHTGNAVVGIAGESGTNYTILATSALTELTVTNNVQEIPFTASLAATAGTDYWFILANDSTATIARLAGTAGANLQGRKSLIKTAWLPGMGSIAKADAAATSVTPWFRLELA